MAKTVENVKNTRTKVPEKR